MYFSPKVPQPGGAQSRRIRLENARASFILSLQSLFVSLLSLPSSPLLSRVWEPLLSVMPGDSLTVRGDPSPLRHHIGSCNTCKFFSRVSHKHIHRISWRRFTWSSSLSKTCCQKLYTRQRLVFLLVSQINSICSAPITVLQAGGGYGFVLEISTLRPFLQQSSVISVPYIAPISLFDLLSGVRRPFLLIPRDPPPRTNSSFSF